MPKIEMGKQYKSSAPNGLFEFKDERAAFDRVLTVDAAEPYSVYIQLNNKAVICFTSDGYYIDGQRHIYDLIEVTPYSDFKRNEPVMVRDGDVWRRRHFSHEKDGIAHCYFSGQSQWTQDSDIEVLAWKHCRRPTPEELAERGV